MSNQKDDIFKITVPLSKAASSEQKSLTKLTERESKIHEMILQNKKITVEEIAEALGVNRRTILRNVQEMKSKIPLRYDKKSGLWSLS